MTPEEMRAAFRAQLTLIDEEGRKLAGMPLPSIFDDSECCDSPHIQVVEPGYWRWEDVDEIVVPGEESTTAGVVVEGPYFHASTDGWDSMSEHGTTEYVECLSCYKLWAAPDDIEWD